MKLFRKTNLVLFLIIITSLFFGKCWADTMTPYTTAYSLWRLQNKIVNQSFKALHSRAWAKYKLVHKDGNHEIVKAVYIGNLKALDSSKRFFVVEMSLPGSVAQFWCRFVPKDVYYKARKYRFETIDPVKIYILKDGHVFYASEAAINSFMKQRGPWSTILFQGNITSPPNLKKRVMIRNDTYITASHRVIYVKVIRSLSTGGEITVSTKVPFGMVKSGNSSLYDFGNSGGERRISRKMIRQAVPFPTMPPYGIMTSPSRFPVPPYPPLGR